MSETRRRFIAEQKAQIVRRHLADKEPVSKIAEEGGLQPSQIHLWVKQLLDQAERAFERSVRAPAKRGRPRTPSSSGSSSWRPSWPARTRSSPS